MWMMLLILMRLWFGQMLPPECQEVFSSAIHEGLACLAHTLVMLPWSCIGHPGHCHACWLHKHRSQRCALTTQDAMQVLRPSRPLAYYVGESDNVRQRLATHAKAVKKRFQGTANAAVVAGLTKGAKSSARKIESSLIKALLEQVKSVCFAAVSIFFVYGFANKYLYSPVVLHACHECRSQCLRKSERLCQHLPQSHCVRIDRVCTSCRATVFSARATCATRALAARPKLELSVISSSESGVQKRKFGRIFFPKAA
jgi:predicted GIY-YIG superfamily endonuclease